MRRAGPRHTPGAADWVLLTAGLRLSAARRMHTRSHAHTLGVGARRKENGVKQKHGDRCYFRRSLRNKSVSGRRCSVRFFHQVSERFFGFVLF